MTEHRQRSIHIHIEQMIIMWHKNRPNLYPIQFTSHRCQSDLLMVCLSLHIVHSNGQNLLFTAHSLNQILLPIPSHIAVLPTLTVQYNPSLSHIRTVSTIADFESTQNAYIIQRCRIMLGSIARLAPALFALLKLGGCISDIIFDDAFHSTVCTTSLYNSSILSGFEIGNCGHCAYVRQRWIVLNCKCWQHCDV